MAVTSATAHNRSVPGLRRPRAGSARSEMAVDAVRRHGAAAPHHAQRASGKDERIAGAWRLEIGDWGLEIGDWGLEPAAASLTAGGPCASVGLLKPGHGPGGKAMSDVWQERNVPAASDATSSTHAPRRLEDRSADARASRRRWPLTCRGRLSVDRASRERRPDR